MTWGFETIKSLPAVYTLSLPPLDLAAAQGASGRLGFCAVWASCILRRASAGDGDRGAEPAATLRSRSRSAHQTASNRTYTQAPEDMDRDDTDTDTCTLLTRYFRHAPHVLGYQIWVKFPITEALLGKVNFFAPSVTRVSRTRPTSKSDEFSV